MQGRSQLLESEAKKKMEMVASLGGYTHALLSVEECWGIEPKVSHMGNKHSTDKLYLQTFLNLCISRYHPLITHTCFELTIASACDPCLSFLSAWER